MGDVSPPRKIGIKKEKIFRLSLFSEENSEHINEIVKTNYALYLSYVRLSSEHTHVENKTQCSNCMMKEGQKKKTMKKKNKMKNM